ncbi:hypothetical protein RQP46_010644 [Phenoliferia psychrophenolica]
MSFCQLIVGSVAVGKKGTHEANQVLVAFTIMFIAGFASTWGPGAWVLISELYPLKAMSLATFSNWVGFVLKSHQKPADLSTSVGQFWNWVIAFCVPYITDPGFGNLGSKIAFICEELDEMFEAGLRPWQTAAWKPTGVSVHGQRHTEKSPSAAVQDKEAVHDKEASSHHSSHSHEEVKTPSVAAA